MKQSWCNNLFNEKLNELYKKTFSVCDFDAVIRYNYKHENKDKIRVIFAEIKYINEKLSESQLATQFVVYDSITWEKFDERSGFYLIQIVDIFKCLRVSRMNKNGQYVFMSEMTLDDFVVYFSNNTATKYENDNQIKYVTTISQSIYNTKINNG